MEKKICVRCNKEYDGSGFMWDFQKNGKQYMCEVVCQDCDKEMNPSRYREDDKDKQIAELQEKLHDANNQVGNYKNLLADVKHRRNLQIADLKKKIAIDKPKDYQGWTNYETWNVKLWIDNEQSSYQYWQERAKDWHNKPSTSEYWTKEQSAVFNLADELKEELSNHPLVDNATMYVDLLNSALSEVNWQEIARSLIEDVNQ